MSNTTLHFIDIILYQCLSTCYWVLFFGCVIIIVLVALVPGNRKGSHHLYFVFLSISSLGRAIYYGVTTAYGVFPEDDLMYAQLWRNIPSLMLLTSYSFMVAFWARKYNERHQIVKHQTFKKVKGFFLVIFNVLSFCGIAVLFFRNSLEFWYEIGMLWKVFMYLILVVSVLFFGCLLGIKERTNKKFKWAKLQKNKFGFTTVLISSIFMLKIIFSVALVVCNSLNLELFTSYSMYIFMLYYFTVEIIPNFIVILIIFEMPVVRRNSHQFTYETNDSNDMYYSNLLNDTLSI
eukprot:TRINITY_DN10823_c0_g1_i1.p1 TRINITY_DN10823_c0_g1~~TRINITY_DN10823_c0_g1_i1.p1  ORF type:complete len:291 (-),score=22.37 TRINITY_DN10823_c0_g1_i1:40-912(-)